MAEPIQPELSVAAIEIYRPIDGGFDVLRGFHASIESVNDEGGESIGTVRGWIGWQIAGDDLHDAADAISADCEPLGAVAAEIVDTDPYAFIDNVLLLDRMHLDMSWRGKRLSGSIIDGLLMFLRLDPETTLIVLQPEPQRPEGGPYELGPERTEALAKLTSAYRASGFEPWQQTPVWWRPL